LLTRDDVVEELTQQMVRPVDLPGAVALWAREKIDTVIDSGPGSVIQRLVRDINDRIKVFSFEKDQDQINKL
jgi:malonyl CoA-acyl carrier protein transacylase